MPTMFSEQAAPTAQGLLTPPSTEASTFARVPVSAYADCSQPFLLGERSFGRQYAHIYAARLIQMRPILEEQARQKWGESLWGITTPHTHTLLPALGKESKAAWPTGWKLFRDFSQLPSVLKLTHTSRG